MSAGTASPLRVGLRADASPASGVGHVVRLLALADELRARGLEVALLGQVTGVPWLATAIQARGLPVLPADADPDRLADAVRRWNTDAVVIDGYRLHEHTGHALRSAGLTVLAVQDGPFGSGQEADLVLDQNVGATAEHVPPGTPALLGLDYVLFRDEVLAARSRQRAMHSPPRAIVFSGGTDPAQAVPLLAELLLRTQAPVAMTAVAVGATIRRQLARLIPGEGQTMEIIAPTPDLVAVMADCDLALSAAGGSLWELMCLGVPAAVVAVADNQQPTLDLLTEQSIAYSLGTVDRLRANQAARDGAVTSLRTLLTSTAERERLREVSRSRIDGRGRERVVDALTARVRNARGASPLTTSGGESL